MKLFIVSGVSGSGKSTALHVFEDMDYYCIDNLPVALLPAFAEQIISAARSFPHEAVVGIDARNMAQDIQRFPTTLAKLRDTGISCEVIFLTAENSILLKRFSETRRKHPLTHDELPLADAIKDERELLEPIANCADLFIDTSHYNIHQLRDVVKGRFQDKPPQMLSILFQSFAYKHGVPGDADFVFDTRCLPNPYWKPVLRNQTGKDREVMEFLDNQALVGKMHNDIKDFLVNWIPHFEADNRSYMTIAIGCTGGQHRSVYLVERLAQFFSNTKQSILIRHRELT